MKLLFDLFPIILFFIAFKMKGIFVATGVAIVASIVQIIYAAIKFKKIEPMLWISLAVVTVFGGLTIILHNETFIKWKPSVLYWVFGITLLSSDLFAKKNLVFELMKKNMTLPVHLWRTLNRLFAAFFLFLGFLNIFVAYRVSTEVWVNFKMFGMTGLLLVFMLGIGVWLNKAGVQPKQPEQPKN